MSNMRTGINIGTEHIEVVQLKKTLTGYQLLKQAVADIPGENLSGYTNGSGQEAAWELRRATVAGALRKVLEDNNIEPVQVVGSIPDTKLILRYFSMPSLPQQEWENAVRFEAQKYIPFRMEEVVSDFFVVQTRDKKKELKVVFVATRKETLNKYLEIFNEASISVVAVEIPSLSLLRLFDHLNALAKRGVSAILALEDKGAVLTICDNATLYLMRDFSFSPQLRTGQIPNLELGEQPPEQSSELEYENLFREIQLSFDYHYKHFPALKIEKLIILGRNNLEHWRENLAKDLKLTVELSNPNLLFKGKGTLDSAMSTALGLALRGFRLKEKQINLLAGREDMPAVREAAENDKSLLLRIGALELILGFSIMLLVNLTMSRQIKILDNNLSEVKRVRAKFGEGFSELDKRALLKIERGFNEESAILNNLVNKRVYLTTQLSRLPGLLPAGVWLEALQFELTTDQNSGSRIIKLVMEGKVFSPNPRKTELVLINEFIAKIKEDSVFSAEFNKIELGFMEKTQERGFSVTSFKINCSG